MAIIYFDALRAAMRSFKLNVAAGEATAAAGACTKDGAAAGAGRSVGTAVKAGATAGKVVLEAASRSFRFNAGAAAAVEKRGGAKAGAGAETVASVSFEVDFPAAMRSFTLNETGAAAKPG